jgi:hypothetical protein
LAQLLESLVILADDEQFDDRTIYGVVGPQPLRLLHEDPRFAIGERGVTWD